jgi:hypothetical protein
MGPGIYTATNRNEHPKIFLGEAQPNNLTAIYELSRQCEVLNISQTYRPPRSYRSLCMYMKTLSLREEKDNLREINRR